MPEEKEIRYAAVKLESYDGDNSFINCGTEGQDFIYVIAHINPDGSVELVDFGYPSLEETYKTWPETRPREKKPRRRKRRN